MTLRTTRIAISEDLLIWKPNRDKEGKKGFSWTSLKENVLRVGAWTSSSRVRLFRLMSN